MNSAGPRPLRQFWLRKLHSLTGFAFLGYFFWFHARGLGTYTAPAERLLFLYLPLLFHGVYGLYITYESRPNVLRYRWLRNWVYFGQRATGLLLSAFVPVHVAVMAGGAGSVDAPWYRAAWYAGTLAGASHLSNGLFGTAVDWGICVGPHSQRVLVALGFVLFCGLGACGLVTLRSF